MATNAISVDGAMVEHARRHIASGRFETVDQVLNAGLDALDREEAAFNEMVRAKIQEAIDDPRPSLSVEEAFAELDRRADARRTA